MSLSIAHSSRSSVTRTLSCRVPSHCTAAAGPTEVEEADADCAGSCIDDLRRADAVKHCGGRDAQNSQ